MAGMMYLSFAFTSGIPSYCVVLSGSPWLSSSSPGLRSPFTCPLTPLPVGKAPIGASPGSGTTTTGLVSNGEVSVGSWSPILGSAHPEGRKKDMQHRITLQSNCPPIPKILYLRESGCFDKRLEPLLSGEDIPNSEAIRSISIAINAFLRCIVDDLNVGSISFIIHGSKIQRPHYPLTARG